MEEETVENIELLLQEIPTAEQIVLNGTFQRVANAKMRKLCTKQEIAQLLDKLRGCHLKKSDLEEAITCYHNRQRGTVSAYSALWRESLHLPGNDIRKSR